MSRKHPTEDECTAYHEAGHAVANYLNRVSFASVSIVPDHETVGRVASSKLPAWMRSVRDIGDDRVIQRARKIVERRVLCLYAASVAEERFKGKANHTKAKNDYDMAADLANQVCGSDAEREKYLDWLLQRTRDLFALPWNWHAVTVLAQTLLVKKEIKGRAARKIIRNALEEGYQVK